MDLIPKPDQVVSAASNVAHKVLYGGLADLRPMPRTLIDEGELREVYHYRPVATAREQGDPVLLVTPLAAPALCFDLRRGCSLVEHFVEAGRPTYLVEYGEVSFKNRALGIEHWVDEVVPTADRGGLESMPADGRCTSSAGASAASSACSRPPTARDLPIASVTVVGSPVDVSQVPLVAPLRPLLNFTEGRVLTPVYRLMGGAPKPLVKWAFQLSSFQKLITKPLAVATQSGRRRLPRPDRGGRPVHREHDRLPGPQLRPALPPVRAQQRAQHRPVRPRSTAPSTCPPSPPRSSSSPAPPTASRR